MQRQLHQLKSVCASWHIAHCIPTRDAKDLLSTYVVHGVLTENVVFKSLVIGQMYLYHKSIGQAVIRQSNVSIP